MVQQSCPQPGWPAPAKQSAAVICVTPVNPKNALSMDSKPHGSYSKEHNNPNLTWLSSYTHTTIRLWRSDPINMHATEKKQPTTPTQDTATKANDQYVTWHRV